MTKGLGRAADRVLRIASGPVPVPCGAVPPSTENPLSNIQCSAKDLKHLCVDIRHVQALNGTLCTRRPVEKGAKEFYNRTFQRRGSQRFCEASDT